MDTRVLQSLLSLNSIEINDLRKVNHNLQEIANDKSRSLEDRDRCKRWAASNTRKIAKIVLIQKAAKKELAGVVRAERQVRKFLGI